jgi:two-component system, sensor histidine kinase and response regulator
MTRVLVVDDSATQAEEARFILESAGFSVEVAHSGQAGLDLLRGGGFDLVVSDIVMPDLTGYELCSRAKTADATKHVPIVLLTSLGDPLDVIQALEGGADGFITKGSPPEQLIHRVQMILENRRLRAEQRSGSGIDVHFLGKTFNIKSEREQILDLLVSTFEDTVRKQQELLASQQQLREANRELEAFSHSAAHDLGSPLRAIDAWLRALNEESASQLDAKGKEHVEHALDAAARMRQIIDDLLRLSRVVNVELSRGDFSLSAVATLVGSNLIAFHPDHEVDFVVEPRMRCPGDRGLVQVVLENLLGNAWKFTRKQEQSRIEVGTVKHDGPTTYFVRDNGAGFDMAKAHKLFLPFERLHSQEEFKGTGIGLTTARRIIDRHGGRIWAEAAPGQGATFYFTIP